MGEIVDSESDKEEVVNTFDESMNSFGGGHDREDDYDDYDYDVCDSGLRSFKEFGCFL